MPMGDGSTGPKMTKDLAEKTNKRASILHVVVAIRRTRTERNINPRVVETAGRVTRETNIVILVDTINRWTQM
jgi:hypothetical protein